jgi:hypothetical protein
VTRRGRRQVTFLAAARDDLARIAADDPSLANHVMSKIRDLEAGRVDGVPLKSMAKTGDLGDCRKLYVGTSRPASHRVVYRALDDAGNKIEVVEIVEVEARADQYAYVLSAVRLGRLPTKTVPEFNRVHQRIIATRSAQRKRSPRRR